MGIVSSVYFVRLLKNVKLQNVTVSALSESLNTIFIGIFYFYCAIVMSQHVMNSTLTSFNNESDVVTTEESRQDPITEYFEEIFTTEPAEEVNDKTTLSPLTTSKFPNEEFLQNYHAFLTNAIKVNLGNKKHKELQKSDTAEIQRNEGNTNGTNFDRDKCFDEVFMENSMFLYSFLHSVVSLIMCVTKQPPKDTTDEEIQRVPRQNQNLSEIVEEGSRPTSTKSESSNDAENTKCMKIKLVMKTLVTFLTPIVSVVALYFAMDQNMQIDFVTKLFDPSKIDSSIWNIIYKPINVSTPDKKQEINDIVNNIYTIVNVTQGYSPPAHFDIYNVNTRRQPKELHECPNFNMINRIYTVTVFLLYFIAILYSKIHQAKTNTDDPKAAKQLRVSITSFATLWFFSIMELFSKTYFFDNNRSNLLTDIFLSLGNLNQLSIITMNYLTAKETVKKYNLVEPKA
jgi:hypothetical protein